MKPPIHSAAAQGFQSAPDVYVRGRPEYPADAIAKLVSELKIGPGSAVVDLGAGTGKLTRALVPTGARLIAVEPVEAMRARIPAGGTIEITDGSAEAIPLPAQSVDAVVVAQAFHWFRGEEALREIRRVLRPGGRLGLIWNVRDEATDWVKRLTEIIDPHEQGTPRYRGGKWREAFVAASLRGAFSELRETQFRNVHSGPVQAVVVDRVMSISFIAALDASARARVLEQLGELVRTHPGLKGRDVVEFPYRTDLYWCEKNQ